MQSKTIPDDPDKHMSFWDHLEELRWVVFKSIIALIVGTGIGLIFTSSLYKALMLPLNRVQGKVHLVFSGPLDAFLVKIKMALLAGIVIAFPFILTYIWSFVAPGLKKRERRAVWFGIGAGFVFLCIGVTFGYVMLPYGIAFLVSFGAPDIQQLWSLNVYMSFCFRLLIGFGIVFQLPVVLTVLVRLGIVEVDTLAKNRHYAVIIALVVSAILTPPDMISQIVLAGPIMLLYELSILAGRLEEKRQRRFPLDESGESSDGDFSERDEELETRSADPDKKDNGE